jgi:putative nucleotidyltransferase with HDIG domain
MAKQDNKGATLLAALASAAVVGVAWAADAWQRDRAQRKMHRTLVDLLLNALTADDPVTARHSRRVADLSYALAESCEMGTRELATLRVAALLHDMGKIDDRFFYIIHSRKPLSAQQRDEIKTHPHTSAHILEPLEPLHPGIQCIVSSHHECWDGSGYPRGLDHDGIPLAARIIAVADAFDAMTQPRSYKEPLSIEEALDKLSEGVGKQFDPALVRQVEHPEVLSRWIEVARRGLEDERHHLAHPTPTEAVHETAGAESEGKS